jgi:hypothetical protein
MFVDDREGTLQDLGRELQVWLGLCADGESLSLNCDPVQLPLERFHLQTASQVQPQQSLSFVLQLSDAALGGLLRRREAAEPPLDLLGDEPSNLVLSRLGDGCSSISAAVAQASSIDAAQYPPTHGPLKAFPVGPGGSNSVLVGQSGLPMT